MLDALQPFLEDKKQTLALNGGDDPIRLILAYFSTDNQNIDELEKLKYNKALYRRLGWQDEEWFDVISSFYQVYCCGLAWVCSGKTCNDYGADWSDLDGGDLPPFRLEQDGTFKALFRLPDPQYTFVKKRTLAGKMLKPTTIYSAVSRELIARKRQYRELAALTHTVANFMPCPCSSYNALKGTREQVRDFLPLMADYAERQGNQEWKDWFLFNREKYCLEDYYYIDTGEDHTAHLKGIPFFRSQSLDHPLPRTEEELTECLDEMIKRIRVRACRLSGIPD